MSPRPALPSPLLRVVAALTLLLCSLPSGAVEAGEIVYVLDSSGTPLRSAAGLCWRTGFWSPGAAASASGSGRPIGCACEADLVPADRCANEPAQPPAQPVEQAPPTPAPVAMPPSEPAEARRVKISAEARFRFGTSALDAATIERLDELARALAGMELEVLLLVGHADQIGPAPLNQAISEKRAAEVKVYLVGKGVPADRIYTEGKGESQPTDPGRCAPLSAENRRNLELVACLAADRRVEIEAIGVDRRPAGPKPN